MKLDGAGLLLVLTPNPPKNAIKIMMGCANCLIPNYGLNLAIINQTLTRILFYNILNSYKQP